MSYYTTWDIYFFFKLMIKKDLYQLGILVFGQAALDSIGDDNR